MGKKPEGRERTQVAKSGLDLPDRVVGVDKLLPVAAVGGGRGVPEVLSGT